MRPKRPYRLELQDEGGRDLKVALLGMPPESDWILHPCYTDKSFVRDALAYELWRAMGHYAPRTRFVELFFQPRTTNQPVQHTASGHLAPLPSSPEDAASALTLLDLFADPLNAAATPGNGHRPDDGYAGLYLLVEKIKRGKHRVNIRRSKIDDPDPLWFTGGYIFKKDRTNPGEKGFMSTTGLHFAFEEPKEKDLTPNQREWLTHHVRRIEETLFGPHFKDPTNGYRAYLDVDSFVDFHWMVEVSRNIDGYWFSQFFHMDRGGKLKAGPIWDWDLSFGNVFYYDGYKTNGWRWETIRGPHYKWYGRLFEDPDFLQRYIDRWSELRATVFATSNMLARVDGLVAQIQEAQARNYRRWPNLGEYVHPNRFVGETYEDEVNWLKNWIVGRLAWIDSQGFPRPTANVTALPGSVTSQVSMSCPMGRIYYMLGGSDPRQTGGGVASGAAQYAAPIGVGSNTTVVARALSEYGLWSAPLRLTVARQHPKSPSQETIE